MRTVWIATGVLGLSGLAFFAGAQTPPANAKDITQMSAGSLAAPSAEVAAPAGVIRVYVDTLQGADAATLAALITQTLFESKQVVITVNQANASLILRGTVMREAVARPAAAGKPRRGAGRGIDAASPDSADAAGLDLSTLPLIAAPGTPVDLSQWRYRLDLEAVDPNGDLVWMSGQGREALAFTGADEAVGQTLQPLLAAVAQLKAAAAH